MRNILIEVADLIASRMPEISKLRHDIAWKPDNSPVTQADLLVERIVHEHLSNRLPNLTFIGEESFHSFAEITCEWVAVLDPIDGTENFCSGLKEWGTSLSIWKGAEHQGSMLLLPELDQRLITGDTFSPIRSRITGFSSSISNEIIEALPDAGEARITGCAVYNLYNVIHGAFARFVNPRGAHSWDLLAGLLLGLEHKCEITLDGVPYDGRFLPPGRKYRVDIRNRHNLHTR